jgi:serine/threonine protein kinase
MGVVYEAQDRDREQTVALKTLRRPDPALLYRLKKEFRSLAEIAHPNLVALHELHEHDGRWFFTMELIGGVGFLDWVRPGAALRTPTEKIGGGASEIGGALNLDRLRAALAQLIAGVTALHDAGKLHRDLKPSNVLIDAHGHLKICDFGLVTDAAAHEQTRSRHAVGTPLYMSPEQAANQPLTAASDWYSVGAMLYVALTGRPPFAGSSYVIMRDKQLFEPPPPSAVATGVPADLEAQCMRWLARDPEARMTKAAAAPRTGLRAELDRMSKEGAIVIVSRASERESVPYRALDGLVDGLAAHLRRMGPDAASFLPPGVLALARLFPVLRRVEALVDDHVDADPITVLRELVTRLAARHRLVLCVEDSERCDPESRAALDSLLDIPQLQVLLS